MHWILQQNLLKPAGLNNLLWWALCVNAQPLVASLMSHGLLARVRQQLFLLSVLVGNLLMLKTVATLFKSSRLAEQSITFICKVTSVFRSDDESSMRKRVRVLVAQPRFLEAAEWLIRLPMTMSPQRKLELLLHGAIKWKSFLPVQLAARGIKLPIPPATRSLAAAHSSTTLLRWLVAQPSSPGHTRVHGDCSDARLLLLVHGYHWNLPEALQDRLTAAEQRRLAFYSAAKQQGKCGRGRTSLGQLPADLIKQIACDADIDFNWRLSK